MDSLVDMERVILEESDEVFVSDDVIVRDEVSVWLRLLVILFDFVYPEVNVLEPVILGVNILVIIAVKIGVLVSVKLRIFVDDGVSDDVDDKEYVVDDEDVIVLRAEIEVVKVGVNVLAIDLVFEEESDMMEVELRVEDRVLD